MEQVAMVFPVKVFEAQTGCPWLNQVLQTNQENRGWLLKMSLVLC
jgi:hypothetical protein